MGVFRISSRASFMKKHQELLDDYNYMRTSNY